MSRESLIKMEYMKGKDGMLYPNLQISENKEYDQRNIGVFGKGWKDYMLEYYPHRLSELIAQGKINETIYKVEEEAEEKKEKLIQDLLCIQPMTETENILERAAHVKMITMQAEEIILPEVSHQFR